jgi:sugar/nucleoside kinase (ribokinase family)
VIDTAVQRFVIPPAKPEKVSDPTGAGDAFRAGFIKGLIMDYPIEKIGKLASTVAVYTVEKYGTQTHRFNWNSVKERYYKNFKEKL